uniref:Hydroxysteroid 11-beta-dehydrogenase 1-like protein n=1 Tax=Chelonoidis abingdonii TaxID=106734 RepID=A0A8C0GAE3_CHEAB
MIPPGKALCAAGMIVGLLAFFWRDTFNPGSISGARVLLTGASTGIGEQMAYHYSRFGAEIVLTARRGTLLQKVMEKCLQLGAKKVFYIQADMSSPQAPEEVMHFALQKLVGLDHLVLNHIGGTPFRMWDGDVEHTRWLMQVNFLSYVALASAALPILAESKGSLIVVSSLTGKISTPFTTSYSATKFALDGFFSSLRHELAMQKQDVCITLCILGLIDTEMALEKTRCVCAQEHWFPLLSLSKERVGCSTRCLEVSPLPGWPEQQAEMMLPDPAPCWLVMKGSVEEPVCAQRVTTSFRRGPGSTSFPAAL